MITMIASFSNAASIDQIIVAFTSRSLARQGKGTSFDFRRFAAPLSDSLPWGPVDERIRNKYSTPVFTFRQETRVGSQAALSG